MWLVVCSVAALLAMPHHTNAQSAAVRIEDTIGGLMKYFWVDKTEQNLEYGWWFSCGQLGGATKNGTPGPWDSCECEAKNFPGCTQCYRWWDAVILETIADHGVLTNSTELSNLASLIEARSPYNATYTGQCTFVDDFAWYTLMYLRVYEWLGETKWLDYARGLHDWTWKNGFDTVCGGIYWNGCMKYKNSITLLEVLEGSAHLAALDPHHANYTTRAHTLWDWFFSFDHGRGLLTEQNLVASGAVAPGTTQASQDNTCCNSTSAHKDKWGTVVPMCINEKANGFSYNQGLLLGTCAYMYQMTNDQKYVTVGENLIRAVYQNLTVGGVIIEQKPPIVAYNQGEECRYPNDPGGDWFSFKGILVSRLVRFLNITKGAVSPDVVELAKSMIQKSSDAAWAHGRAYPPFNESDVCNDFTGTDSTHPKFNWVWGVDSPSPTPLPADPSAFFVHQYVQCMIDDSAIVSNLTVDSERECASNCTSNSKCHIYSYCEMCGFEGEPNCQLFGYTRTSGRCNTSNSLYNFGVKRPSAGCTAHCGSSQPVQMPDGGSCFCDDACVGYMDCCLDFADICYSPEESSSDRAALLPTKPAQSTQPWSCSNKCNTFDAAVLPGGGYCWCDASCLAPNLGTTCCGDYAEFCAAHPLCMDPRSQGSVLALFVAELALESV